MLGLGSVPSLIQLGTFFFVPESPRWLSGKGRFNEAKSVLEKVRNDLDSVEEEIESYQVNDQPQTSIRNLISSPTTRRALILGCLLQVYQQLAGINTVM